MARRKQTVQMMLTALLIVGALFLMRHPEAEAKPKMRKMVFGKIEGGQPVDLYLLSNNHGMSIAISNFGATLVSLKVPDAKGDIADVVLGYDNPAAYQAGTAYFGGTIGRYANRIAHGKFVLNGVTYSIPLNDPPNSLHGGTIGFNKRVWTAKDVSSDAGEALELTYVSADGEEGFPGKLTVAVVYTLLADQNTLRIDYSATTDQDTILNLTNHSYFNLSGQGHGDILHDVITLNAGKFTPVDATLIPTGQIQDVHNTPFDFLKPTVIGARINQDNEQLKLAKGYDQNWVLNKETPGSLSFAARAYDPHSGRALEISTTEPAIQLYTGNHIEGTIDGKDGQVYRFRSAFCLETQHFPDSPNHANFPATVLKPGQTFRSTSLYKFSVRAGQ